MPTCRHVEVAPQPVRPETARHAGHADLLREAIDGAVGQ